MNKKIMIIFVLFLFLPMAAAADWDNKKGDLIKGPGISDYGKIEIRNSILGIPFLETDLVAEIELKENSDTCIVNCYAEGELVLYEKYNLIDSIRFNKINKNKYENINQYNIFIKKEGKWIEYDKKKLDPGNYSWRIQGKKNAYETVDWLATFAGMEIDEWALWGEDYGTVAYFDFNENTGITAYDQLGNKSNLTGFNTPGWTNNGILDSATKLDGSTEYWANSTSVVGSNLFTGYPVTINLWFNASADGGNDYIIRSDIGGSNNILYFLRLESGSLTGRTYASGADKTVTTAGIVIDEWYMATLTINTTQIALYVNGLINKTATTGTAPTGAGGFSIGSQISTGTPANFFNGTIDEVGIWNRTLSASEISNLYNSGAGLPYIKDIVIGLNEPTDAYSQVNNENITFNISSFSGINNLSNLSLFIDNIRNDTSYLNGTTNLTIFSKKFLAGNYNWSVEVCDVGDICMFSENRTFTSIAYNSTVLNAPADNYSQLNNANITFNITSNSDGDNNLSNLSLFIDNVRNLTSYINGTTNETIFSMRFSAGTYNWSAEVCDVADNCYFSANRTFNSTTTSVIAANFNVTTYETSRERFMENITTSGSAPLNPFLQYNGTSYAATATNIAGNNYSITSNIDIPKDIYGNLTWYFNFSIGGVQQNGSLYGQKVEEIILGYCNASLTSSYINFTFADEGNLSLLNTGTIPLSNWNYYIGSGTINKNFTYTNNTGSPSHAFCFSPTNKSIITNYTIQYKDSEGNYPQRVLESAEILTNSTTNTTLYLLLAADGQYVTFQVINTAEQPIGDTHIIANRTIDGTQTIVGEGDTDASGSLTLWLNPDYEHTITFNATGYSLFTSVLFPTQTAYTIQLGGTASPGQDFNRGINYTINPQNQSLFNDTTYDFDFILTSNYWEVTEFGFVLLNSTGNVTASNSVSANGGTATVNYNVGNSTDIINMNYYWVINNTYINSSKVWYVYSSSGTDWSILNFINDITTYITGGLFGLGDFGKSIIIFLIIFVFVGVMSFKFGLVSPAGISGLTFALVLMFDVGFGLIPNPVNAVPNFPTIFVGIIMASLIFREVYR